MSATAPQDDLVKTLDRLTAGAGLSTQQNRSLPAAQVVPPIPSRVGVAQSNAKAS
ncbi:hypothetical protein [Accumulibacter sp.]|jgi:hypothetical protein|uniref:hypothetical protein n=1 Tax=Accumulibacter sp. TaxID=2053492 RepID=UPI002C7A4C07|nr:hypothetical protein [Accumulibacter sp.]HRF06295.1 hypothetical protein [Accumulibacter sp.]